MTEDQDKLDAQRWRQFLLREPISCEGITIKTGKKWMYFLNHTQHLDGWAESFTKAIDEKLRRR